MNGLDKFMLLIAVVVIAFIGCMVWLEVNTQREIKEGKIVNVETFYNNDGNIDYMVIYFEDGTKFDIYEPTNEYTHNIDLTHSSSQIVKLRKRPYDNHWYIEKIIKVPEEK